MSESEAVVEFETFKPGDVCRFQVVDSAGGRCSTVWRVVSGKRRDDMYVVPMAFGHDVKVSLHESGSWQVGFTEQGYATHAPGGSRHWEIWKRPEWTHAPGVLRAWYVVIPDEDLHAGKVDPTARHVPSVGADHAASIEFVEIANGAGAVFDNARAIGKWPLAGGEKTYHLVSRRIQWPEERRAKSVVIRKGIYDEMKRQGAQIPADHVYFAHGHDEQGIRFFLELGPFEPAQ